MRMNNCNSTTSIDGDFVAPSRIIVNARMTIGVAMSFRERAKPLPD